MFVLKGECEERNLEGARIGARICQNECYTDEDCDPGKECLCDSFCGRSCVNKSKIRVDSCIVLSLNW